MSSIHATPAPGAMPTEKPVVALHGRQPKNIVEAARACPAANVLYNRAIPHLAPDAMRRWEQRLVSQQRIAWLDEHRAMPAALTAIAQVSVAVGAQAAQGSPWRTPLAWQALLSIAALQAVPALTNRDIRHLLALRTPVMRQWWNTAPFLLLIGTSAGLATQVEDLTSRQCALAAGITLASAFFGFFVWETCCAMHVDNHMTYVYPKPRPVAEAARTFERLTALPTLNDALHAAVWRQEEGSVAFLGGLGVPMDLADGAGHTPMDIVLQEATDIALDDALQDANLAAENVRMLTHTTRLGTTLLRYGATPTADQFSQALDLGMVELARAMLTVPQKPQRHALLDAIDLSCLWQIFALPAWRFMLFEELLKQLPAAVVKDFLNKRAPDAPGTLLHHAAGRGYKDLTLLFTRHGADPHLPDRNGIPAAAWCDYLGAPRHTAQLQAEVTRQKATRAQKPQKNNAAAKPFTYATLKAMPLEVARHVFKQLTLRDLANVVQADPSVAPLVANLYPQHGPKIRNARGIVRTARLLRRPTNPAHETARTLPVQDLIAGLNIACAMHARTSQRDSRAFVRLAVLGGYRTPFPNALGWSLAENIIRSHAHSPVDDAKPRLMTLCQMLAEGVATHAQVLPIALEAGWAKGVTGILETGWADPVTGILTRLSAAEAQGLVRRVKPRALFAIRDDIVLGDNLHKVLNALFARAHKSDVKRFINYMDNEHPRSLLHLAAVNRRHALFAALLRRGSNPHLPDETPYQTTAANLAAYDPALQDVLARAKVKRSRAP